MADATLHEARLALLEDLPSSAPLSMALAIEERAPGKGGDGGGAPGKGGGGRTWNG